MVAVRYGAHIFLLQSAVCIVVPILRLVEWFNRILFCDLVSVRIGIDFEFYDK